MSAVAKNVASAKTAFELLREIEDTARAHASPPPRQVRLKDTWNGIGFEIDGTPCVTGVGEVVEIMRPVPFTRVPGTLPWVLGLANVRGELLPVFDLQRFIGAGPLKPGPRARILVIHQGDLKVGLLVAQVLGRQRFFHEDLRTLAAREIRGGGFVQAEFIDGEGRATGVFSMNALANDERFLEAAS